MASVMTWQTGRPPCDGWYFVKDLFHRMYFYSTETNEFLHGGEEHLANNHEWLGPITPEMCEEVGEARELVTRYKNLLWLHTAICDHNDNPEIKKAEAWLKKTEGK